MKKEDASVYISFDGRKFLDEKECADYEEKEKSAKCYKILYAPDLTETGRYTGMEYLKVYPYDYMRPDEIALDYCIRKYKCKIGVSVQGHGQQSHWEYHPITSEQFNNPTPIILGGMRLSYRITVIENYDHREPLETIKTIKK